MEAAANPIRRVVKMLQAMSDKVKAEGEKEKELFEKYQCYCKTSGGTLQESISAGETKVPQLQASIDESKSAKAQVEQELKDHKTGREEAEAAVASADSLRSKESTQFSKESEELMTNIDALTKAISAISTGMGSSFLQTKASKVLQSLVVNSASMSSTERDMIMAFLESSSSQGYVPQSGEIVGMLKQIKDGMEKDLEDITTAEEEAKKNAAALVEAKKKEIAAHTEAIEAKTERSGKLAVEITEMGHDLEDTQEALDEDKKFLADLEKNCDGKEKEWEEISKLRSEEMIAIAETIKILNDDDALELFKKTLPSPSLVQVTSNARQQRKAALAKLHEVTRAGGIDKTKVAFITLALNGKMSFEKVMTLIDELVETLAKEQSDDDNKVSYCEKEFDTTEDDIKVLQQGLKDAQMSIEEEEEKIATLTAEIKALTEKIAALDKEVADATATRKEENEAYSELMSSDNAAKELLGIAKNRLQKFYNPKLYVAPPKRVLAEDEQIANEFGVTPPPTEAPGGIAGTGVMALIQLHSRDSGYAAPPPPPESFGPYAKKAEMSNGIMKMIDMLVADLDKEMQVAEVDEKDAQADYETYMEDAAAKRALDSKATTTKQEAKATSEASLQSATETKGSKTKELSSEEEYLSSMHADCDWLIKNFDLRKKARADEVDALKSAKAVLAGADYSLVQVHHAVKALRGSSL
eukprot:CAMPEP_0178401908 /NCGR_PEP_ID=MMETSP0689_2-20121128/16554_1 /TAXON_ID=160604 /ORGANISM="Amphidinium massartii, Strain CS-259" /LENGTH=698 /DNA_ID=CAMNT_0020022763 /DNA_START=113 /DNA_END=2209 /DNA_ORIENTATION=-